MAAAAGHWQQCFRWQSSSQACQYCHQPGDDDDDADDFNDDDDDDDDNYVR